MKKYLVFVAILLFLSLPSWSYAAVHVNGYFKANGTYVAPYYRSSPDGNPYNNYSFPGNTNPYTGKVAPGNADTYLYNYYNKSTSGSASTGDYTSSVYNSLFTPIVLPTKNLSYVTKLWSDSNPNISCSQSTFLRQNERQECDTYRANKMSYTWNVTTSEYDDKYYHYDNVTGVTTSCLNGYTFLYSNGLITNKCTPDKVANTSAVICPVGYTCTPTQ